MSLFWAKPESWKTTDLNILTFPPFLLIALVYRTGPQHHTVSSHCGIKQEEEGEKKKYFSNCWKDDKVLPVAPYTEILKTFP